MVNIQALSRNALGNLGESLASEFFYNNGFEVYKPTLDHFGDLMLISRRDGEIFYIEVKATRTHKSTVRKEKSQSLVYADFVLVYQWIGETYKQYLIPSQIIQTTYINLAKYERYLI